MYPPVGDEAIAGEIVELADRGPVGWCELVERFRGRGVSLNRLRRILQALVETGRLVELPCRLFTTHRYLEETPVDKLREEVAVKIKRLGLRRCGKPLTEPYRGIRIHITHSGEVRVEVEATTVARGLSEASKALERVDVERFTKHVREDRESR